jgi:hypothetical protein
MRLLLDVLNKMFAGTVILAVLTIVGFMCAVMIVTAYKSSDPLLMFFTFGAISFTAWAIGHLEDVV